MLFIGNGPEPDGSKEGNRFGLGAKLRNNRGGVTPGVVKIIIILLVVVLIGGTGFAVFSDMLGSDSGPDLGFNPEGRGWVPMDFEFAGMELDVPGEGWQIYYDARTQIVFKDNLNSSLDVYFLGASALNPDMYRIDNKPQVFTILSQRILTLDGWDGDVLYTVVRGNEDGFIVNKHQLFFRRTFRSTRIEQTYTYLVTMTISSGRENQYAPLFQHIIDSIRLYEAD